MFYNCRELKSLNLTNFNTEIQYFNNMFLNCNNNLKYCIDDNKNYSFLDLLKSYEKNCGYICIYNSKKYIMEENICIDNCETHEKYKYECNNVCYSQYHNCNDNEIMEDASNKLYLIYLINPIAIVMIIIFIIIYIKLAKIKIIFTECNQNKYEVKIHGIKR